MKEADKIHQFWQAEIPYLGNQERGIWQGVQGYDLRTLTGQVHSEDSSGFAITSWGQRLYLWTWRWLVQQNSEDLESVLWLLTQVDFNGLRHRMDPESFWLINNSLQWLSLFDASSSYAIKKLRKKIRPAVLPRQPVYEFESAIIYYLKNRQAQELEDLKRHSLWHENLLSNLVSGSAIEKLKFVSDEECGQGLCIDVENDLIIKEGEVIISAPACFIFESLKARHSLSFDEISYVCLGQRVYDPFSQSHKIYNLISKIKSLAPADLHFYTKNEKLYAVGSWAEVKFKSISDLSKILSRNESWKSFLNKISSMKSSTSTELLNPGLLNILSEKSEITRVELEAIIKKSRSTTNRVINILIKKGIIEKTGKAKNTKYVYCRQSTSSQDLPK